MTFIELMNNTSFAYFLWGVTFVTTILFIWYAVSKEGRDEHGKAILGTSCFYGIIALFIFINILMAYSNSVMSTIIFFSNSIRLMFNGFLIVVLISIAVLRKTR